MSIQRGLAIEEGQTYCDEEQDVAPVREELQHRVGRDDKIGRGEIDAIRKSNVVGDRVQARQEIEHYRREKDGERSSETSGNYERDEAEGDLCEEQKREYAKYDEVALMTLSKLSFPRKNESSAYRFERSCIVDITTKDEGGKR